MITLLDGAIPFVTFHLKYLTDKTKHSVSGKTKPFFFLSQTLDCS